MSADFRVKNGIIVTENATILEATDATSATDTSASIYTAGGVAVSKKLYVGTNLDVQGTSNLVGAVTLTGDLAVNGGDITTSSTTGTLFNSTATTVRIGEGATTAISIGSTGGTGTTTVNHALTVSRTLTASSTVSLSPVNANVTISPSGTGIVTIAPVGGGNINNMTIGATTPRPATFSNSGSFSARIRGVAGSASTESLFLTETSKGTLASPTQILNNDVLLSIAARGYTGSAFAGGAKIEFTATENITGSNQGTKISLFGVPAGGTATNELSWNGTVLTSSAAFTVGTAGTLVTLAGNLSATASNQTIVLSPTGTGTVAISPVGALTINPTAASTMNNVAIGGTTATTAKFTTLDASGQVQFTAGTAAGDGTGTVIVTGGAYLSGGLWAASSSTLAGLSSTSTTTLSPNNASVTISPTGTGTVTIAPATAGNINNMNIGASTRGTGAFTTLTADAAVTFTQNTTSTSTTTGTLVVTGGLGVSGAVYAGSIQSTPIGSTTRSTGAFTSLAANAAVTFTQNTASTTTSTGTLVVTGGVGVSGNLNAGGNVVSSLSINSGVVIRGGSGASSEGGQISIGYGNNAATTITGEDNGTWNIDVAAGTANNDFRIFRKNISGTGLIVAQIDEATGRFSLPLNITSSSTTTGTLVVSGGVGVAGRISTTDLTVTNTITGSVSGNAGTVTNGFYTTSSFNLGTTSIAVNRASAAQSLTGISIDGNAGTVTNGVYTTGDQTIGGVKTFSSRIVSSAAVSGAYTSQDENEAPFYATVTHSASSYCPIVKLRATGAANVSTVSLGVLHNPDNTQAAVLHFIQASDANNRSWTFAQTGDFTSPGNVTAFSDERVKTNWKLLPEDFVSQLAGIKSGIYDRTDVDITQVGVSAQSLRTVLPQAVIEDANGQLSVAYGNAALAASVELAKEIMELKKLLKSQQLEIENLRNEIRGK